jgi:squalene-hopene/tetraprenyl-beta-curcumene cyclase
LSLVSRERHGAAIANGVRWLAEHENADGGWGDSPRSISNISTTFLARAAFHLSGDAARYQRCLEAAEAYIRSAGGLEAMKARYGKDRTFAVPILTNCALAGQVAWQDVPALPFELACLPQRCFEWIRLPVVSYALPALIAIGQARHFHCPSRNRLARLFRSLSRKRTLSVLESIQPSSGGFLEAIPLTSFVTMSLASIGQTEHPVARKAVEFLTRAARPDGSWPIDINLSVWLTTLAVNALGNCGSLTEFLQPEEVASLREWLLGRQFRQRHPYTNAAPGGWGWTHLPGSVPDADDTAGAMLALRHLRVDDRTTDAAEMGAKWLLGLQNQDGGWPTFCRGRGHLPFDRSGTDLTAHAIRALHAWQPHLPRLGQRIQSAIRQGFPYLEHEQRPEGCWVPLWFGNRLAPDEENPTYGTARVLAAFRDTDRLETAPALKAWRWLLDNQNDDGGWGGVRGVRSSVEETALALDAMFPPASPSDAQAAGKALEWLRRGIEDGNLDEPTPIGFYFAKLWYFEKLYPLIFSAAALGRCVRSGLSDGIPAAAAACAVTQERKA